MPKSENQKRKLLYLAQIFERETDEEHGLTLAQISAKLLALDIRADRKTLYQDFEELREFGLDIIGEKRGRQCYYFLGARDFELPELKLLVDSVQSARFITDKKSHELIRKLEGLVSVHQARQLHRQVIISGRVKTMNESIYYNVDKLHEAVESDRQIRFQYFQWNVAKEMELRRGGAVYQVSPWCLTWDDENYYLVAYDAGDDKLKHYRVDKMLHIALTDEKRAGRARFEDFDVASYTRRLFGMYAGKSVSVTLEGENAMAGILIDRFGQDIWMRPIDGEHFTARVDVAISPQFLGWVFALGAGLRITGPESVVRQMQQEARRLMDQYGTGEEK